MNGNFAVTISRKLTKQELFVSNMLSTRYKLNFCLYLPLAGLSPDSHFCSGFKWLQISTNLHYVRHGKLKQWKLRFFCHENPGKLAILSRKPHFVYYRIYLSTINSGSLTRFQKETFAARIPSSFEMTQQAVGERLCFYFYQREKL